MAEIKYTDQQIVDAYVASGRNVHRAGRALGVSHSQVHRRLQKIGGVIVDRHWTEDELAVLRVAYADGAAPNLKALAVRLGRRSVESVCLKAGELGLTRRDRPRVRKPPPAPRFVSADAKREWQRARMRAWIAEHGHPRGALGLKHTDDVKRAQSARAKAMNAAFTPEQLVARTEKMMRTKNKRGTYAPSRVNVTWKSAWREIGGVRAFFRSRWEANYARYLQWQKERGLIVGWKHEPITFWFSGVKRGTVSYLPDFEVTLESGAVEYHEVKGWMDARSKTKIKRMAKYHPTVKLVVIDSKRYAALQRSVAHLVDGWEMGKRGLSVRDLPDWGALD